MSFSFLSKTNSFMTNTNVENSRNYRVDTQLQLE